MVQNYDAINTEYYFYESPPLRTQISVPTQNPYNASSLAQY